MGKLFVPARSVAPAVVQRPTQATAVQTGAPIIEALDIVGRSVSDIGRVGAKIEAIDQKEQARVVKLAQKEKDIVDKTAVTDAVTISKGALTDKLDQLKTTRVKASAEGMTAEFDAFARELFNKTSETLTPDQKEFFVHAMLPVNTSIRVDSLSTERNQIKGGQIDTATASKDISTKNIINNFENPLVYAVERSNIEDQIDVLADINKWDADTKQINLDESLAVMEEGRIRQWAVKDASIGKELFTINKDRFDLATQDSLDTLLNTEDAVQTGGVLATEAMAQGTTETERLDWLKAHPSKSEATNKEARSETRIQSQDEIDAKKRANIKTDDDILTNILQLKNDGATKSQAMRLVVGGSSGKEQLKLRNNVNGLWKPVDAPPIDITTPGYNDLLDNTYRAIQDGKFTSLGHLRRNTVGKLNKADQKEVEDHWQSGGLPGGIGSSQMATSFKRFAGMEASENTTVFMSAWRYVANMAKTLPPGTKTIGSDLLDKWMDQAVLKEADEFHFFSPSVKGLTLSEKQELGTAATFDVDMTSDEVNDMRSKIEEGNKKLIAAGKQPWPTTTPYIKKAFLNSRGAVLPKLEAPPILAPVTPAPAPPVEAAAEVAPPEETIIKPFRGAAEPLRTDQIKELLSTEGKQLTDEEAFAVEEFQYPERVRRTVATIIRLDIPEKQKSTMLDNLLKIEGIVKEGEEAPERKGIIPEGSIGTLKLPEKFEAFKEALRNKLEDEGFDFSLTTPAKLEAFFEREFEASKEGNK